MSLLTGKIPKMTSIPKRPHKTKTENGGSSLSLLSVSESPLLHEKNTFAIVKMVKSFFTVLVASSKWTFWQGKGLW